MPVASISSTSTRSSRLKVEDSNMAGVGTDEDKAHRKMVAGGEPAWEGIGNEEGMWIFRIEKFEVKPWPKDRWGEFYAGDSYILLHVKSSKDKDGSPKLQRDVHFWLGESTTIDEQGTAAIKTVELDDFFDGEPIQHREVMNFESKQFLK